MPEVLDEGASGVPEVTEAAMTMLVGAFVAGVILMATGFLSDWNERRGAVVAMTGLVGIAIIAGEPLYPVATPLRNRLPVAAQRPIDIEDTH